MTKSADSSRAAWARPLDQATAFYEEHWDTLQSDQTIYDLSTLLAEVRRETIEECARACETYASGTGGWAWRGALECAERVRALLSSSGEPK